MIDLSDPNFVYVAMSYAIACLAVLAVSVNLRLRGMRLKRQLESLGLADIGQNK